MEKFCPVPTTADGSDVMDGDGLVGTGPDSMAETAVTITETVTSDF